MCTRQITSSCPLDWHVNYMDTGASYFFHNCTAPNSYEGPCTDSITIEERTTELNDRLILSNRCAFEWPCNEWCKGQVELYDMEQKCPNGYLLRKDGKCIVNLSIGPAFLPPGCHEIPLQSLMNEELFHYISYCGIEWKCINKEGENNKQPSDKVKELLGCIERGGSSCPVGWSEVSDYGLCAKTEAAISPISDIIEWWLKYLNNDDIKELCKHIPNTIGFRYVSTRLIKSIAESCSLFFPCYNDKRCAAGLISDRPQPPDRPVKEVITTEVVIKLHIEDGPVQDVYENGPNTQKESSTIRDISENNDEERSSMKCIGPSLCNGYYEGSPDDGRDWNIKLNLEDSVLSL